MDARTAPHLARSSSHGLGSGESTGSGRMNAPAWLHVPRARSGPTMARIPSWLHFQALGRSLVSIGFSYGCALPSPHLAYSHMAICYQCL